MEYQYTGKKKYATSDIQDAINWSEDAVSNDANDITDMPKEVINKGFLRNFIKSLFPNWTDNAIESAVSVLKIVAIVGIGIGAYMIYKGLKNAEYGTKHAIKFIENNPETTTKLVGMSAAPETAPLIAGMPTTKKEG